MSKMRVMARERKREAERDRERPPKTPFEEGERARSADYEGRDDEKTTREPFVEEERETVSRTRTPLQSWRQAVVAGINTAFNVGRGRSWGPEPRGP